MQGLNYLIFYAALMLVAGLGIPVMAALNGGLGGKLQSSALATTILLLVGLFIAASYLIIVEGIPSRLYAPNTPWYYYFGGFFVMFYILSITWVVPRFGVANAISFVLLGQLIAMSFIDHFGFVGVQQYALTPKRIVGLVLMIIGVFMTLSNSYKV